MGKGGAFLVRGEEVGILLVVLCLWIFAVILFFHRWGKIRMLEPYHPSYQKEDPNIKVMKD